MADDWITAGGKEEESSDDLDLSNFVPPVEEPDDEEESEDAVTASEDDAAEDDVAEEKRVSDPEKAGILNDLRKQRDIVKQMRIEQAQREAILQERLDRLTATMEGKTTSADPAAEAPDINQDPIGYMVWMQEQNAKKNDQVLAGVKAQVDGVAQKANLDAVMTQTHQKEVEFLESEKISKEEYDGTLDVFRNLTSSLLNLQGYNESQIPALVSTIEYNLITNSLRRGENPAKQLYELISNSQFAPKSSVAASNGGGNLDRMRRGKAAAVSLSKAGGGAQKRRITVNDLASMSPDKFAKIMKNPAAWETINVKGHIDI